MKSKIEQYVINKVREKRQEQKMSQATLAYCVGLSRGFIGDAENPQKRTKYNFNHLNEFAKIFNCSIKDFLPKIPFDNKFLKKCYHNILSIVSYITQIFYF